MNTKKLKALDSLYRNGIITRNEWALRCALAVRK